MMTGGTIPWKPVLLLPQSPNGEAACSCRPGSSKTPDPACTQQTRTPAPGQARPQGQRQTRGAYTTGTAASVHFLCFCSSLPLRPSSAQLPSPAHLCSSFQLLTWGSALEDLSTACSPTYTHTNTHTHTHSVKCHNNQSGLNFADGP